MTVEANKALVRRYIEDVWNARALDAADGILASTYTIHQGATSIQVNPEILRQAVRAFTAAFPDFRMELRAMLAEDDRVVAFWTNTGTHLGDLFQPDLPAPIAATGAAVAFDEVGLFRIDGGRVVEAWYVSDRLSLLRALGIGPTGRVN